MSWFNTSFNASSFNASSFTSLAKSAINKAQKSIDKVLDISEENAASASGKELSKGDPQGHSSKIVSQRPFRGDSLSSKTDLGSPTNDIDTDNDSFFSSFLGDDKAEKSKRSTIQPAASKIKKKPTESHPISPKTSDVVVGITEKVEKQISNSPETCDAVFGSKIDIADQNTSLLGTKAVTAEDISQTSTHQSSSERAIENSSTQTLPDKALTESGVTHKLKERHGKERSKALQDYRDRRKKQKKELKEKSIDSPTSNEKSSVSAEAEPETSRVEEDKGANSSGIENVSQTKSVKATAEGSDDIVTSNLHSSGSNNISNNKLLVTGSKKLTEIISDKTSEGHAKEFEVGEPLSDRNFPDTDPSSHCQTKEVRSDSDGTEKNVSAYPMINNETHLREVNPVEQQKGVISSITENTIQNDNSDVKETNEDSTNSTKETGSDHPLDESIITESFETHKLPDADEHDGKTDQNEITGDIENSLDDANCQHLETELNIKRQPLLSSTPVLSSALNMAKSKRENRINDKVPSGKSDEHRTSSSDELFVSAIEQPEEEEKSLETSQYAVASVSFTDSDKYINNAEVRCSDLKSKHQDVLPEIFNVVAVAQDKISSQNDSCDDFDPNQESRDETQVEKASEVSANHTQREDEEPGSCRMSSAIQLQCNHEEELKRLRELVEARESKMVALSKENIDLQEANSILRNQLAQAEEAMQNEGSEMEEMREEFAKRIRETDNKLQTVTKERDGLRKQLTDTEESLTQSANEQITNLIQTLREKEEQIQGLLEEGESLSRRELQSNTTIKKLRSKVKNLSTKEETQSKKITDLEAEIVSLKENVEEAKNSEKKSLDELKKLEGVTDQQEDEISKLKDQLDDAEERMKAMQTSLDSAHQEINFLSLEKANKESEAEEGHAAVKAKEELQKALDNKQKEYELDKEQLLIQLEDLRLSISRMEQMFTRREENFKQEINDLQQRLQESEERNHELSQAVSAATRPLLRQIENLQSTHSSQAENWERIEKNMTERLASAQQQVVLSTEKERSASEFAMEMKTRITGLESQIATLRQERSRLSEDLENERTKAQNFEEELQKKQSKHETILSKLRTALEALQNEKTFLENQLNADKIKHETELARMANELRERRPLSRQNSNHAVGLQQNHDQDDVSEVVERPSISRSRTSSTSSSSQIVETTNKVASTAFLERLHTQLRQKDGEVHILQEQVTSLERTRASLAQELVTLSNRIEELEQNAQLYSELKERHQDLEKRYNTTLQMYGEKAEEADELRMDLEDVKQMFKQQIQDLLGGR